MITKTKKYKCCWCGKEFYQIVTYIEGDINPLFHTKGKKTACSTQVRCSGCLNFIPTWPKVEGAKIRK